MVMQDAMKKYRRHCYLLSLFEKVDHYLRHMQREGTKSELNWSTILPEANPEERRHAAREASHFHLRRILHERLLVCVTVANLGDKLFESLNARIVAIPNDAEHNEALRFLSKSGDIAPSSFPNAVAICSIASEVHGSSKINAVHYKLLGKWLELTRVEVFRKLFARVFEAPELKTFREGYLKSFGTTSPQRAHFDYDPSYLAQDGVTDYVYLAFTPLTPSGMFLQVWPAEKQPGQLVFIPYRQILLVPANTVHGGGFLGSRFSDDLRLHFYVYLNYKRHTPPDVQSNYYFNEDRYPQSKEADTENPGLVARYFFE